MEQIETIYGLPNKENLMSSCNTVLFSGLSSEKEARYFEEKCGIVGYEGKRKRKPIPLLDASDISAMLMEKCLILAHGKHPSIRMTVNSEE